ncbi:hypothetical protein GR268_47920, partial [Rhizobium leguminosarum]|nr:hypothetical protein [Rhizobium leguminosarum]
LDERLELLRAKLREREKEREDSNLNGLDSSTSNENGRYGHTKESHMATSIEELARSPIGRPRDRERAREREREREEDRESKKTEDDRSRLIRRGADDGITGKSPTSNLSREREREREREEQRLQKEREDRLK